MLKKYYWAYWLAVEGIGVKTWRRINHFLKRQKISWPQITSQSGAAELLNQKIISAKQHRSWQDWRRRLDVRDFLSLLKKSSIKIVGINEPIFPKLLKQIEAPPPILYFKGRNLFNSSLIERTVAVVGTRHITNYGRMVTDKIVSELVAEQIMIVSGLMTGVDLAAHQAALQANGLTIGVLGYGFNFCYPATLKKFLAKFLDQGGMIVSQFSPFVRPTAGNFPSRNRIVAGLSLGVLVTEAALKSGSHITAHLALDYGRSVYAVPGPITNPYSQGTKWLINQGAKLIDSGSEIVVDLQYNLSKPPLPPFSLPTGDNQLQNKIIDLLSQQELTIDQLQRQLSIDVSLINVQLTLLEISQKIQKSGEVWSLKLNG